MEKITDRELGMIRYFCRPLSMTLFFAITLQSLCCQTNDVIDTPIFRKNARTVVVDVVVTGREGDAVKGLNKDEFLAYEDGHAQRINGFEEHFASQGTPSSLPPLPKNVFSNIPRIVPTDAVTVLLLDSLNTPLAAQADVHAKTLKYLREMQPGRRFAIFTLARRLRFVQGFTDDPGLLIAALKSPIRGASAPQASPLLRSYGEQNAEEHVVDQLSGVGAGGGSAAAALKDSMDAQIAFETDQRALMTLDAFQELAGYLAGVPGRKNVIWFSGAFPVVTFSNPKRGESFDIQRAYGDAVRKTDTLLAAAQVAIYPIAAEGLQANSLDDPEHDLVGVHNGFDAQQKTVQSLQDDASQRNADHATMDEIAKDTGGEAIYNTNDLNGALSRVSDHGASYYTLYYTPTNTATDGQYRKIQVRIAGSNYKLAYRHGYYADAKVASIPTVADPLFRSMIPGLPNSSQIPIALRVQPSPVIGQPVDGHAGDNATLKGPFVRYGVDIVIAERGLQLDLTPDGGRRGKVEVTLTAYNSNGKAVNWLVRQIDLTMNSARFYQVQENGVNLHFDLDVPKDGATLRAGVYDWRSQMVGTLEIPFSSVMASPTH